MVIIHMGYHTMGFILLEGGAEFNGLMREADLEAMRIAGGADQPIGIIPAAARPDNNHLNAAQRAKRWFHALGATDVHTLPLFDPASANDPEVTEAILGCKLLFILGGFPHHLALTLSDSLALKAIRIIFKKGSVIAGSSAGAMVLSNVYFDPYANALQPGVGLMAGICVVPHYNTYGKQWLPKIRGMHGIDIIVGIDERTGLLSDSGQRRWQVLGEGQVSLHRANDIAFFSSGSLLTIEK
jgi:cyanophycinase